MILVCPNCLMTLGKALPLLHYSGTKNGDMYACEQGCKSQFTGNFMNRSQPGIRRIMKAFQIEDKQQQSEFRSRGWEPANKESRLQETSGRYIELPDDGLKKS